MSELEWVPLVDSASRWPGVLWWDARGRVEELRRLLGPGAVVVLLGRSEGWPDERG